MDTRVLVPTSLVRDAADRRDATQKLGWIARSAAIYGVSDLVVYPDPAGAAPDDGELVATVLRYATTPPYLRKEAFGRRDELAAVGVLPPLRLPTWTGSESTDSGSIREGIVTEVGADGRVRVNCGLQHPISLAVVDGDLPAVGERVTVRVSSREPVRAKLLDEEPAGPRVSEQPLSSALSDDAGLRIATSRLGHPITVGLLRGPLAVRHRTPVTLAFGAPGRGLAEICESLGIDAAPPDTPGAVEGPIGMDPDRPFDLWLNTVPDQRSEVVRTEEAVIASLACLHLQE